MGKKIPLPELPANVSSRLSPTSSTAKRAEVDISTCLQHYYSPLASDYAVHLLHKSKWTQRKTTLFHLNTAVKMWKVGSRQGVWVQGDGNKGTAIRGRTRGWPRRSVGACRRSKWTWGQTKRSLGACRRSKRTQRRLTRTRRRPRRSIGACRRSKRIRGWPRRSLVACRRSKLTQGWPEDCQDEHHVPVLYHLRQQQHWALCQVPLWYSTNLVTMVALTRLQTESEEIPNCCMEYVRVQSPYPEEVAYFCFLLKDDIKFIILCCSSDLIKYFFWMSTMIFSNYLHTIKCSMKICLVVTKHLFRIQTNYLTFDIQHHKRLMSLTRHHQQAWDTGYCQLVHLDHEYSSYHVQTALD